MSKSDLELKGAERVRVMLESLKSDSIIVRTSGAENLADAAMNEADVAIPMLVSALDATNDWWTVRFGALEALSEMAKRSGKGLAEKWVSKIQLFLTDEDVDFVARVAECLGHQRNQVSLDPLVRILGHEYETIRDFARRVGARFVVVPRTKRYAAFEGVTGSRLRFLMVAPRECDHQTKEMTDPGEGGIATGDGFKLPLVLARLFRLTTDPRGKGPYARHCACETLRDVLVLRQHLVTDETPAFGFIPAVPLPVDANEHLEGRPLPAEPSPRGGQVVGLSDVREGLGEIPQILARPPEHLGQVNALKRIVELLDDGDALPRGVQHPGEVSLHLVHARQRVQGGGHVLERPDLFREPVPLLRTLLGGRVVPFGFGPAPVVVERLGDD